MLKLILAAFNKLNKMLEKYEIEQSLLISDTEQKLRDQRNDLATAAKLAQKLGA